MNHKEINGQKSQHHNWLSQNNMILYLIISIGGLLVIISGLCINTLQLINYLTVKRFNIHYYRKINYLLEYSLWSQFVGIGEWWSRTTITFFYGDDDSEGRFYTKHCIGITNHRYELDPLMCWMCCDRHRTMGNSKAFAKKSLMYLPIVGWGFFFGECIFLDRNWKKDSENIGPALDRLMDHQYMVKILIAAEGTRFTQEKYIQSMQFARENGYNTYKYHLLPRVKGFSAIVKYIKDNHPECELFNIQMAFDDDEEPSATNYVKGIPSHGDMYIKRIPIETVPTDSEEKIKQFLFDLFSEKDRLMEYHKTNGKFPGKMVQYPRGVLPLLNLILWQFITGTSLFYFLWKGYTSGNWILITIISALMLTGYAAFFFGFRAAKIDKSSKYGINDRNKNRIRMSNSEASSNKSLNKKKLEKSA